MLTSETIFEGHMWPHRMHQGEMMLVRMWRVMLDGNCIGIRGTWVSWNRNTTMTVWEP